MCKSASCSAHSFNFLGVYYLFLDTQYVVIVVLLCFQHMTLLRHCLVTKCRMQRQKMTHLTHMHIGAFEQQQ